MQMRIIHAMALAVLWTATGVAYAQQQTPPQTSQQAQQRLQQNRRALQNVSAERARLQAARDTANRQLQELDEKVSQSARALAITQTRLEQQNAQLAQLQTQRDALAANQQALRAQLQQLLRAAQREREKPAIKQLLLHDGSQYSQRMLRYYGYVQRHRSANIQRIQQELAQLADVEQAIAQTQAQLQGEKTVQQQQIAQLQHDRQTRNQALQQLQRAFDDHTQREQALGRDIQALETVLRRLQTAERAAAAQRARAAQAQRQRQQQQQQRARDNTRTQPRPSADTRTAQPSPAARRQPNTAPNTTAANRAAPTRTVGGMGWPLSGQLLANFGSSMPDGRTSSGLLIAAPLGSAVHAVADGRVVFAEWMTGYGQIIIIDHGDARLSLYAHNEALLANVGQQVRRGQRIATVGTSGGQAQPALYFELRHNGAPVNPRSWLQQR